MKKFKGEELQKKSFKGCYYSLEKAGRAQEWANKHPINGPLAEAYELWVLHNFARLATLQDEALNEKRAPEGSLQCSELAFSEFLKHNDKTTLATANNLQ